LWRTLAPRPSLFPEAPPDSGLAQDVVSVDYVALTENGFARGMWSLAVPDHALGRAMQRSRLDPAGIVLAAHTNLLRLRVAAVISNGVLHGRRRFWVRAGPGAFCCRIGLATGRFNDRAEERVWAFAHTWYGDDMLQRHHVVLTPDGAPGEQLGDKWLKPLALRRFPSKSIPHRRDGLPPAFDACRPPPETELRSALEELAGAELVIGEYHSGEGQPIKGDRLWGCIQAGEDPTEDGHVQLARVRVANTTQVELLCVAFERLANGQLDSNALGVLRSLLLIAATIPDGQHDAELFDVALARADAAGTLEIWNNSKELRSWV
jgi:hypothetical protein